jgi:hypothetical protein
MLGFESVEGFELLSRMLCNVRTEIFCVLLSSAVLNLRMNVLQRTHVSNR